MASAAIFHPALISAEEYLNSSYEPDMEFVDGLLEDRAMLTFAHNMLERFLLFHFAQFEGELGFTVVHEVRTTIIAGARYRIPDVMLISATGKIGKTCDLVPWVVVEVLSPDDTIPRTRARFRDYADRGVANLVLMDPEECVAYRFEGDWLTLREFKSLTLPTGEIPFDTSEIFGKLRAKLASREQES